MTSPREPRAVRPPPPPFRLPRPRRRLGGFVASLLFHAVILLLIVRFGIAVVLGSGNDRFGERGGGGGAGGSVHLVDLPAAAPSAPAPPVQQPVVRTVPPPAIDPAPVLTPPPLNPLPMRVSPIVAAVGTASDGTTGQGPGTGGGTGAGVGTGVGNDSGPGSGGDGAYILPGTRVLIFPPDCARGRFTVQFSISAQGHVTGVAVEPQPKDAGCRQQMLDKMKQYEFSPARTRDGRPVAVTFDVTVQR